jgi:hypothetical protein
MSIGLPKQRDRMAAFAAAQMEMSAIVSENRITGALTHNVPYTVDQTHEVGDEVLVFREKEKKWTGPMVVVLMEDKIIIKDLESERVLRFSTQQIKPFFRDSPSPDVDEDAIEITHVMLSTFTSTDATEKSPPFQVHLSEVIGPSGS